MSTSQDNLAGRKRAASNQGDSLRRLTYQLVPRTPSTGSEQARLLQSSTASPGNGDGDNANNPDDPDPRDQGDNGDSMERELPGGGGPSGSSETDPPSAVIPPNALAPGAKVDIFNHSDLEFLKKLDHSSVLKFVSQFKPHMSVKPTEYIDNLTLLVVNMRMKTTFADGVNWVSWPTKKICDTLLQLFPAKASDLQKSLRQRYEPDRFAFEFDVEKPELWLKTLHTMYDIESGYPQLEIDKEQFGIIRGFIDNQFKNSSNPFFRVYLKYAQKT
jgi:hypothetical protein